MIVHNLSVKVDHQIEEAWLQWQQEEHIAEILKTQLFIDCKIFKLLNLEEDRSSTYIIQLSTDDRKKYELYQSKYAEDQRLKAFKKWGNAFIAYGTLMQQVV
ncbi:MAG: DUF4286 family protein [Ginsengibacter sp.]